MRSSLALPYAPKPHRMHPKRFECPAHLKFVATLPCLCCLYSPAVGHHLLRGTVRGVGMRAGDDCLVSLCERCHQALHADGNESRWFLIQGVPNALEWASYLFEHSGDRDRCMSAICGRMMD